MKQSDNENQIKLIQDIQKDKDEIIKKLRQENEDLQNENQVLLDTTQQLIHEKDFLQKNYNKFRKAIMEYKKQEKKEQNEQQLVQSLELKQFINSILNVLEQLSKTKMNQSQKELQKHIIETKASLDILKQNLKMTIDCDNKIFEYLKIIYNKKIFFDNEDTFLNDLNLNILQKKNFTNALISLFRDDKKTVFEDKLVEKNIRKIDNLSIQQKRYLNSILTQYFQQNFQTLKDVFQYLSNDDIKNVFKDQIYQEIIQYLKQNQFGFYSEFLTVVQDQDYQEVYNRADEIKQQNIDQKMKIIEGYKEKDKQKQSQPQYINPQKFNSEFLQDLEQYELPSSFLYKERLINKLVYDIKISEKKSNINTSYFEYLKDQIQQKENQDTIQEFLKGELFVEYKQKNIDNSQQQLMLQFKYFLLFDQKIKDFSSTILQENLEIFLQNILSDIDQYLIEISKFLNDLEPQIKKVLLEYILNNNIVNFQQQQFLQKLVGNYQIKNSLVKVFKSLSYFWNDILTNEHQSIQDESSLNKFNKIIEMCSPYYSKILLTNYQSYNINQKIKQMSKDDIQLLNHHLLQIYNQKHKLQDLEDIYLYVGNINLINVQICQVLFYLGFYIIENSYKVQINDMLNLNENIMNFKDLYDQDLIKKIIKEYTLLENTSQYLIYETFLLLIKGHQIEENLILLLKLGKDVYKLAVILIDLCFIQWELQNLDDNYTDETEILYQNDFEQFLINIQQQEVDDWFGKSDQILGLANTNHLSNFIYFLKNNDQKGYYEVLYNSNNISYKHKKFLYNYFTMLRGNYENLINQIPQNISNQDFLTSTLPLLSFYLSDFYQRELVLKCIDDLLQQDIKFLYDQIQHIILKDFTSQQFQNILDIIEKNDSDVSTKNVMRLLILNFEQLNKSQIKIFKSAIENVKDDIQSKKQFIFRILDQIIIFDWIIEDKNILELRQILKNLSYDNKKQIIEGLFNKEKMNDKFFDFIKQQNPSNQFIEKIRDQCFKLEITPYHRQKQELFDYHYFNILTDYFQEIENLVTMQIISQV